MNSKILNRRWIIEFISDLSKEYINFNKITILAYLINPVEFYILCEKKTKKKYFLNKPDIYIKMDDKSYLCHIMTYDNFEKMLVHNNKYYWSVCDNNYIILDLSNEYNKILKSANHKKNWWPIFKKIFY